MKVSFDEDAARALSDTHFWGALALTPEEKMNVEDPLQMEKLADALPIERTASRWIVTSDPQEMAEKIGRYVDLGFNHLVFHAPGARPGALHQALRRARAAAAAQPLRLNAGPRAP